PLAGTGWISSAVADDFDGTAISDVAFASYVAGAVIVLIADGTGGFHAPASYPSAVGPYYVESADVNGDGRVDLLAAGALADEFSVFLGDGRGGFGAAADFLAGGYATQLEVGDVSGDGRADVLTLSNSSFLGVHVGDGAGGFREPSVVATGRLL